MEKSKTSVSRFMGFVGVALALFVGCLSRPPGALAQATLRTCGVSGFGTPLDALFTNSGISRSARDDGAYRIPEADILNVFGTDGIPFASNSTELYVNVNGESGYFDRSLDAYGRDGLPCRRCGAVMRREKFMNRSSCSCPRCQPRPRR